MLRRLLQSPSSIRIRRLCGLVAVLCALIVVASPANAVTAIEVGKEQDRIDINALGTFVRNVGDQLQIETAPGADGLTDRMSVSANTRGSNPNWLAFALRNVSDTRIERLLIADRYSHVGSGILGPRLDARKITKVTPSIGFVPDPLSLDGIDGYQLIIEPGQTVTFAVELASDTPTRFTVWRALDYEKRARNKQLLYGVLLGITGLLAVFLSAVFAANHKIIFPAAAFFTWCVLAYLLVDFGFWHKLFAVQPQDNAQYRAATEAAVAASLLIFVYNFLRLGAWHGFPRLLLRVWIVAQLALVAFAFIDPRLAATFARLSTGVIFAVASLFIAFLALRLQDRAVSLVPVWMLLGVWVTGMGFLFTARLQTDAAVTALTSGLVLIVLLIGFTVTQYAFRSVEPVHALSAGDQNIRLLALENSGSSIWEWSARRDEITVGPGMEAALGLPAGDLHAPAQVFLDRMHPVDRDRMRQAFDNLKETGSGDLRFEFRMRHVDNDYRWFMLEAATDPATEGRRTRCVGLVRETTDSRSAQERFDYDAVHDSVTGLPNRALFIDRLGIAVTRARSEPLIQPTVIVIDVDRFQAMATATQHFEADGLLITLARRLGHLIGASETLARIGSDQFGILLLAARPARELHVLADSMRIAVRSLIKVGGVEITPTAAIGYAVYDRTTNASPTDLLDDAEIAMHRARRQGRDAVLAFTPDLRTDRRERAMMEADLREAIEKRQLTLQYQPIYAMRMQQIVGYEALVRWEHPRLGKLDPAEFVPLAEQSDLIVKLGSAVISMAVADLQRWHAVYQRPEAPLTVSVNVSRRQLLGSSLVNEIRNIITSAKLPKGCLRLEVTETLVMENPEHAANVLSELVAAGAGLSLDDFGTGYSSLTYLNVFPFDTIKIDRALVQGSSEAGTVSAILRSVITLAHELGKKVVAEGIENEQDAAALRTLGCEYAQGYYYDPPQTPKDVLQSLKDMRKTERRSKRGGLFMLKERRPATPIGATAMHTSDAGPAQTSDKPAASQPHGAPPPLPGANKTRPARRTAKAAPSHLGNAARFVARSGGAPATAPPLPRGAQPPTQAPATSAAPIPIRSLPPPHAGGATPPPLKRPQNDAAVAASASLAALGAEMARPQTAGSPQQQVLSSSAKPTNQIPASILDALARSADASPPVQPPATSGREQQATSPPPPRQQAASVDYSALPAGIVASLANLAGNDAGKSEADTAQEPTTTPRTRDPLARFVRSTRNQ